MSAPGYLVQWLLPQGDGACFEGDYTWQPQTVYRLRERYPEDADLHRIVDSLQAIQLQNEGQLHASFRHHGQYYHENGMTVTVERNSPNGQCMTADSEGAVTEAIRELARWLYGWLESDYEWKSSDVVTNQSIRTVQYTFTKPGQRFG